jgi:predicted GIY-YIG superfamily endonuclease
MRQPITYMLHLSHPLRTKAHANRHYIGWTYNLSQRLAMHHSGHGARFTQVAVERGSSLELARTWEGGRATEQRLKRQKNAKRFCPICRCFEL